MKIYDKLLNIQSELIAPKNQRNKFGNYNYRSCEDILMAIKPLLDKNKVTLIINDEVVEVEGRHYIKATATLVDVEGEKDSKISVSAYARESESKKGMDQAQITGSTSSYARKYALNGLFCIDDTKDGDATNTHEKISKQKAEALKVLAESKKTDIKAIEDHYGVKVEDMTEKIYLDAVRVLNKK